jgi:outer membrane protein OmpA-like peptidoglycan-associated protein
MRMRIRWTVLGAGLLAAAYGLPVHAHGDGPLMQGPYLAPMASYILTDDEVYDDGLGGVLAAGYRNSWWAVEAAALLGSYNAAQGEDADFEGGTINGLVFPFSGLPNLFALIGAGGLHVNAHPVIDRRYTLTTLEAGVGHLWPLSFGRYEFAIRTDARWRTGKRERRVDPGGDLDIPTHFDDTLIQLGLQLPLRMPAPEPEPVPEPVVVVPIADSDGDGVLDDRDQCPDTPRGTEVDSAGCPLPPPPPPPCEAPGPGERVSLAGCGTGDVLILQGVHFEHDRAALTPDARTILDGVAEELNTHVGIAVEIGGHTDSLGSDRYNQRLSEQRALAVHDYLVAAGVDTGRLTVNGYGEARPVADNDSDDGRQRNRRVELTITADAASTSVSGD